MGDTSSAGQYHPAFAATEGLHPHLHADPLHQGLHVGDDPDLATGRLQESRLASARSRLSGSRVPKPSSMNSDSTWVWRDDRLDRASASASDTRKLSPPERESTERTSSPCRDPPPAAPDRCRAPAPADSGESSASWALASSSSRSRVRLWAKVRSSAAGRTDKVTEALPVIRHRLLGSQFLLQGARFEGRRLGLGQRALALEQLLVESAAVRLQRRQPAVELRRRQRGQLGVMLAVTIPLALLQCQRPLPLGQTGTRLGAASSSACKAARRPELIRAHGQQAAQVIFGDAEAAGVGSPAPQHLPSPTAAHLLLLLQMAETGLELGLALAQGGPPLHRLQLARQLLQPLLPAALDQGNLLAPRQVARLVTSPCRCCSCSL